MSTEVRHQSPLTPQKKQRKYNQRTRDRISGYLYISPFFLIVRCVRDVSSRFHRLLIVSPLEYSRRKRIYWPSKLCRSFYERSVVLESSR